MIPPLSGPKDRVYTHKTHWMLMRQRAERESIIVLRTFFPLTMPLQKRAKAGVITMTRAVATSIHAVSAVDTWESSPAEEVVGTPNIKAEAQHISQSSRQSLFIRVLL